MACIEPREEAVRCFNKHERFPLSHLYFIFAHVSPLLSISFLSFSFRQPPECVKKNSFTYLLYTTTYNIVQYAPFSPPPLPLPSQCVSSPRIITPELISLLYELHLSTTSTSGPITPTASLIYHNFTFKAG